MATAYEYHGAWFIQWSENGTRKKEWIGRTSVVSEREAKLRAKAKEVELTTGKVIFTGCPTLSDFIPEYLAWHEREYPSSYFRVEQIIRQHLEPVFGFMPMDAIKARPAEIYKQRRLEEVKSATVTKELRTLKAILNRAYYWEILPAVPLRRIEEPQDLDSKPPQFYTIDQLEAMYESDPDYRYVWQLFANTGLRRSEGQQLKTTDVHKNFIRVLSTEDERTKSAKWRDVPITRNARTALKRIDGADGYVLPRIRKESLSRAAIRAAERIGVDGSLHVFRHTYCSHLVMAGVPLRTVQILAGHSSIEVTEKYAHLAPDYLKRMGGASINL